MAKISSSLQRMSFWSEEMEEYRQIEEMECSKCELFLYCRGCPSVSYGEYGDWKRRDPQCWKGLL